MALGLAHDAGLGADAEAQLGAGADDVYLREAASESTVKRYQLGRSDIALMHRGIFAYCLCNISSACHSCTNRRSIRHFCDAD